MEWVETTGKSLDQAKDLALDQLGIGADDAEFEVLEEPRTGLFGRVRGEARVRARVMPAAVRPKQDRRNRRRPAGKGAERAGETNGSGHAGESASSADPPRKRSSTQERNPQAPARQANARAANRQHDTPTRSVGAHPQGETMTNHDAEHPPRHDDEAIVNVDEVRAAAEVFTNGLVDAFGLEGTTSATVDGNEIEVRIDAQGDGLGLLIGPGGRTLLAIQDLARVAAQRRLGDHETRLRIDVAGYREKRRVALEQFARGVANKVIESGIARSLEAMPSSDRKVIHDTLTGLDGVVSRSEGEDPNRRIIVSPA